MTTRFVLATANPDKAAEIESVLRDAGADLDLVPLDPGFPGVEETGATLEDNARLKAVDACTRAGVPALADDTGLEVDALDGEPGVRTARFAGEDATYADNVRLLLQRMERVPSGRRTACFSTVAIARWPDGREVAALGTMHGTIATAPRGTNGFGYDPGSGPAEGDGPTLSERRATE